MAGNNGGYRPGSGRPKGSKNKMTIAKEAVAEVLEVDDPKMLVQAVHSRGHALLTELERITLDPCQPVAARILAAKVALPFLLPKPQADRSRNDAPVDLVKILNQRRDKLAQKKQDIVVSLSQPAP